MGGSIWSACAHVHGPLRRSSPGADPSTVLASAPKSTYSLLRVPSSMFTDIYSTPPAARARAAQAAVEAAKDPAQRALEVAAAGAKLVPKDTRSLYPATPTGSTDVLVSLAHTIRAILGPIASARQYCERKYNPSVKSLN